MGICAQCEHFRRTRPVSQILAGEFKSPGADVAKELKTLQEEERKLRDAEAESMRLQASMNKPHFLGQPRMTDFCALEEPKGIFLIAEMRNAGGRCSDFKPRATARRACIECAHNVVSEGRARDMRLEALFVSQSVAATAVEASTSDAESALSRHRQGVTAGQAFEISSVVLNRGELPTRPAYLDHCKALSTADTFVVSVLRNPHHSCPNWEAKKMQPLSSALEPTAMPVMAPPPGGMPFNLFTPPAASPAPAGLLAHMIAAFEWLLDITIPPAVRDLLERDVGASCARNDQQEVAGLEALIKLHQIALAQPAEVRLAIREAHQPEVVANLRAAITDPASLALIALYDAANAPIAWGNPPLTREIANCYLDLVGFVQSLSANTEWQPLPEPMRGQQIQMLTAQYPSLPPEQQAWFGTLPRGWTQMRATWVVTPPEARGQLRAQILASLGVPRGVGAPPPYAGPHGPQAYPPPEYHAPPPPAPAASQGGDKTADDLMREILADDKAKEAEAARESPQLAMQVRMQNNLRNAEMLSNIMKMRHEMSMTFARNTKA